MNSHLWAEAVLVRPPPLNLLVEESAKKKKKPNQTESKKCSGASFFVLPVSRLLVKVKKKKKLPEKVGLHLSQSGLLFCTFTNPRWEKSVPWCRTFVLGWGWGRVKTRGCCEMTRASLTASFCPLSLWIVGILVLFAFVCNMKTFICIEVLWTFSTFSSDLGADWVPSLFYGEML